MDKLKEVLKYQFWILLGVALILPFVGWIMGTSGMMSEAAERTKKLNDLKGSLKTDGNDPNNTWSDGLAQINVDQEKQKDIAWRSLYELQKPKMVWPAVMTGDADWPADNDPDKMNNRHLEQYRIEYRGKRGGIGEVEKVRRIVKPILDDDSQEVQLVVLDPSLMPSPDEEWLTQAPSIKQVKAAQEDLWLLMALLECIAKVNEGAPNAYDAPIRQIDEILLRGGTKGAGASASKSAVSSAAGPTGTGTMADMMKGMPSMMGGMRGGEFGGGGGGALDYKINPDEDLGPERPSADSSSLATSAGPSSAPSSTTGTMADMMKGMPSMMGPSGMGGLGGRQSGGTNMERYRDEQKEFKTRGFSLQVVMDHRRIPDLLVALSNCEAWPINVLRVHEADYKDEDLVATDGESPMTGRMSGPSSMMRRGGGMSGPAAGMLGPEMMRGIGRSGAPKAGIGLRSGDEGGDAYGGATRSALDDPNLANVAIVGVIYIFNKPPDPPPAPASAQPGATPPVAATTPAAETPAGEAPAAAEASDAVADTADKTESAGADETKPDDSADAKTDTPPEGDTPPGKPD
jgi:hypothetical protein